MESPLPLNRLPTNTRIWFEVHDAGTVRRVRVKVEVRVRIGVRAMFQGLGELIGAHLVRGSRRRDRMQGQG